ncbi:MAG: hypothetical protein LQ340_007732, partial [Diploschistes diacapsis]
MRESRLGSYTKRLFSRTGGSSSSGAHTGGSNGAGTKERSGSYGGAAKKFVRLDHSKDGSALSRDDDEIPLHEVK